VRRKSFWRSFLRNLELILKAWLYCRVCAMPKGRLAGCASQRRLRCDRNGRAIGCAPRLASARSHTTHLTRKVRQAASPHGSGIRAMLAQDIGCTRDFPKKRRIAPFRTRRPLQKCRISWLGSARKRRSGNTGKCVMVGMIAALDGREPGG